MTRFHLFWVRTAGQWDDGFVVARTARAAATYVREEKFVFDRAWSSAERFGPLPDQLQEPAAAVGSTDDDPRHVFWASPEVLRACGVIVVHPVSPRVFFWKDRLLTEGVLDYIQAQQQEQVHGPALEGYAHPQRRLTAVPALDMPDEA